MLLLKIPANCTLSTFKNRSWKNRRLIENKDLIMFRFVVMLTLIISFCSSVSADERKSIIYQVEKTATVSLPDLMMKVLQKPDYIELPLVLSKDDILVVYNDIFLHPKTNVAEIFPERKRQDGNYYLIDFSMKELKQLSIKHSLGKNQISSHLWNYQDVVLMIKMVAHNTETDVQILPVVKYPWFHNNEGKDISSLILEKAIAQLKSADTAIYLKCFDPDELQRISKKLLAGLQIEVRLILGVDEPNGNETMRMNKGTWVTYNYDWIYTRLGLRLLSKYAYGLSLSHPYNGFGDEELMQFIDDSHSLEMKVYLRLQDYLEKDEQALYEKFLYTYNSDGIGASDLGSLKKFLHLRGGAGVQSGDNKTDIEKLDGTGVLDDPEALSRRLKQIQ